MLRQGRLLAVLLVVMALLAVMPVASAQEWGGDKFVLNEEYVLGADQELDGNLAVVGGSATLEVGSSVHGDVGMFGGRLIVAGTVDGDVTVLGGSVELLESAVLRGDLVSLGGTIDRSPGAIVEGETLKGLQRADPDSDVVSVRPQDPTFGDLLGRLLRWQLGTFALGLMMALIGIVVVVVAPKGSGRIAGAMGSQPALAFAIGLLTFILAMLAGALLLIACGLGLLVWLGLAIAWLLGWIAAGLWFGQRLLALLRLHTRSSLAEVAVGMFLLTVVARLPWCIGFLVSMLVGLAGLGAVIMTRFGTQDPEGPASVRNGSAGPDGGGSPTGRRELDRPPAAPDATQSPTQEGVLVPDLIAPLAVELDEDLPAVTMPSAEVRPSDVVDSIEPLFDQQPDLADDEGSYSAPRVERMPEGARIASGPLVVTEMPGEDILAERTELIDSILPGEATSDLEGASLEASVSATPAPIAERLDLDALAPAPLTGLAAASVRGNIRRSARSPKASQPAVPPGLIDIVGIGPVIVERLKAAGISGIEEIAAAAPADLARASALPLRRVLDEDWVGQARRLLDQI